MTGEHLPGCDYHWCQGAPECAVYMARAQPTTDVVEREDAIDEALRKLHYEAFVAGVCYGRDDWPTDDEEWADLRRGIESEAIGEHYEGWSPETKSAIAALTNPPA